ncbi:MAG: hypothetical protein ABI823_05465 [Bryobacteraceae bacterium]
MKTTLELPDATLRKAKAKAAERGVALRQYVTEAVEEKLRAEQSGEEKPWMKFAGGLRDLKKETQRINRLIADEFERIDPQDWK